MLLPHIRHFTWQNESSRLSLVGDIFSRLSEIAGLSVGKRQRTVLQSSAAKRLVKTFVKFNTARRRRHQHLWPNYAEWRTSFGPCSNSGPMLRPMDEHISAPRLQVTEKSETVWLTAQPPRPLLQSYGRLRLPNVRLAHPTVLRDKLQRLSWVCFWETYCTHWFFFSYWWGNEGKLSWFKKTQFCYNLVSDQNHIVLETPHLLQDNADIRTMTTKWA